MNIRSVTNAVFSNTSAPNWRSRLFGRIPNVTIKNEEFFNKIGRIISRPDIGRGILGATAIFSQPFIDYYNPKVDRDTAKVSTTRTIGKIIAGTTIGCAVRSMCYYGVQALTCVKPNAPTWRKLLLPPDRMVRYLNRKDLDWVKNYNSVLASLIGLGVMLFTNMLLDVPLTQYISNKLRPLFGLNADSKKTTTTNNSPNEVEDVRAKILEKFNGRNKWRADV